MRIALIPHDQGMNSAYRSILPLLGLANRGHDVQQADYRRPATRALARWCDVLHIHRWCEEEIVRLAQIAKASGAAVVWDDDDDSLRPPEGVAGYTKMQRGRARAIRLAARRRLFRIADLVTTTNRTLAEVFRGDGARTVHVIENYLLDQMLPPRRPPNAGIRAGIQVGWYGGDEHHLDLEHIPIVSALEDLLEVHPDVHLTTIGLRLRGLRSERYEQIPFLQPQQLMQRVAGFDIGIAPLSPEIRINRLRSNVKVKEYAVLGVPWLASPIGPFEGLGQREGGRLVADDRWFEELDALVRDDRARHKLAGRAASWGHSQLLSRNLEHWERAFRFAVGQARQAA